MPLLIKIIIISAQSDRVIIEYNASYIRNYHLKQIRLQRVLLNSMIGHRVSYEIPNLLLAQPITVTAARNVSQQFLIIENTNKHKPEHLLETPKTLIVRWKAPN